MIGRIQDIHVCLAFCAVQDALCTMAFWYNNMLIDTTEHRIWGFLGNLALLIGNPLDTCDLVLSKIPLQDCGLLCLARGITLWYTYMA